MNLGRFAVVAVLFAVWGCDPMDSADAPVGASPAPEVLTALDDAASIECGATAAGYGRTVKTQVVREEDPWDWCRQYSGQGSATAWQFDESPCAWCPTGFEGCEASASGDVLDATCTGCENLGGLWACTLEGTLGPDSTITCADCVCKELIGCGKTGPAGGTEVGRAGSSTCSPDAAGDVLAQCFDQAMAKCERASWDVAPGEELCRKNCKPGGGCEPTLSGGDPIPDGPCVCGTLDAGGVLVITCEQTGHSPDGTTAACSPCKNGEEACD